MTINERLELLKSRAKRREDLEAKFNAAVSELAPPSDPNRFPLSPSACTKPMRDLYYGLINFFEPGTIPMDPLKSKSLLTFELGHAIESIMSRYTHHAFHVKYAKQRVEFGEIILADGSKRVLSGELDDPIVVDGTLYLTDYKSSADYSFKLSPKEDNIAQMQVYMHSKWGRKNNVNKCILKYFNKNTSEIKFIEIEYDADVAEMLIQRLYKVWEYYLRREIPPREVVLSADWYPDYSSYKTHEFAEFGAVPRRSVEAMCASPTGSKGKFSKDELRAHVLKYGNANVRYVDRILYARLTNSGGLELVELGKETDLKYKAI